jgi:GTP pyrophosphokinase
LNQLQLVKTAKARSKIRGWLQNNGYAFETEKKETTQNAVSTIQQNQKTYSHKAGTGKPAQEENEAPVKIRIGDTTNFMINVAKCCSPKFGDEIVGYVSRGRGIIVHKKECKNFERIPNIEERYIPVIWEETKIEPKKKK